jgi:hypothetical protein
MSGHKKINFTTTTGLSSVVGGISWVVACFVHNSLPQGCIDEGCDDATMRGSTPVDNTFFVIAGVMLAVSGLALLAMAGQRAPLGKLGVAAAVAGGCGLLLLAASAVVSTFVDNDWDGMPGLVIPGILLLAAGLVLVAALIIRRRVVPFWSAAVLIATAVVLPFANEQTSRILLAVPFGVAWAAFGLSVLRRRATGVPSSLDREREPAVRG